MRLSPLLTYAMNERKTMRAIVLLALVAALTVAALLVPVEGWAEALLRPQLWQTTAGVGLFIGLYVVWNFALPPAPLQALAGVHYGVFGGLAVIIVSTSLANALSHGLARWLGRAWVAERVEESRRLGAVEQAVDQLGWKGVALLRLSNLIPSNIANLIMGVTSLRLTTILWASIVGSLPGWLLMLLLGRSGIAVLRGQETTRLEWGIYAASALAALALLIALGRYAREILAEQQPADEPS